MKEGTYVPRTTLVSLKGYYKRKIAARVKNLLVFDLILGQLNPKRRLFFRYHMLPRKENHQQLLELGVSAPDQLRKMAYRNHHCLCCPYLEQVLFRY